MEPSPENAEPANFQENLQEKLSFAEEVGLLLERHRLAPRSAGRLFGYLLFSSQPHPTARDLANDLSTSRGPVSARLRVEPGGWPQFVEQEILGYVAVLKTLAERGLALVDDGLPEAPRPLKELLDACRYYERELRELFDLRRAERTEGGHIT